MLRNLSVDLPDCDFRKRADSHAAFTPQGSRDASHDTDPGITSDARPRPALVTPPQCSGRVRGIRRRRVRGRIHRAHRRRDLTGERRGHSFRLPLRQLDRRCADAWESARFRKSQSGKSTQRHEPLPFGTSGAIRRRRASRRRRRRGPRRPGPRGIPRAASGRRPSAPAQPSPSRRIRGTGRSCP